MRTANKVVAILCADIHLSTNPPAARRGESDWFEAMERTLRQLRGLSRKHDCPIFCAGDVFDRWNSPPELINFAIAHLPIMFAVPGQHDLPFHNKDLITRSAFQTLVLAGVIGVLPRHGVEIRGIKVHGFGWGDDLTPAPKNDGFEGLRLAVVHKYIWTGDYGFPGASEDSNLRHLERQLKGYSAAVFGDNHKGFQIGQILNAGTLFRRKSDEIEYTPSVGMLYGDGTIRRCNLYTLGEKMESVVEKSQAPGDFDAFIGGLSNLTSDPLCFVDALKQAMTKCPAGIRKVLEEVIDEG